jgi:hypothetical protein
MVAFTCNKQSKTLHIQHTAALVPGPLLSTVCSSVRPKDGVTSPVVDLIKKLAGVFEHPKEFVTIVRRADSGIDCMFFRATEDGPLDSDARIRK